MGVCAYCRARHQRQATRPAPRGDQRRQALPRWPWRTMRWRPGSTGWLRQQCVAVRCGRVIRAGQRPVGWLLGERATRGPPEERQSDGSQLSASATVDAWAGDAHRRSAVEPCPEAATGEVGWDQEQRRLWPGCHRHTVTVLLAYSVVVWLEWRQRRRPSSRGRPRDPCSPAPGPTAAGAAGDPS